MGEDTILALDTALRADEHFRRDLAVASTKDPPATISAIGDLAGWLLQQVGELRRAKQRSVEVARQHGNAHPSKLLGDAAAEELAAYNYASGCMLDVESYRQAVQKLGEESEVVENIGENCIQSLWQTSSGCIRQCSKGMLCTGRGIGLQKLSLLATHTGET